MIRKLISRLYKTNVAISFSQKSSSKEQLPKSQTQTKPASSKPSQDAFLFAHHLRFDDGVQLINAQLLFVSLDDTEQFLQLSERALFLDEEGLAIKLAGERKHIQFS